MVPETSPMYNLSRAVFQYAGSITGFWLQRLGLLAWTEQRGTASLNQTELVSQGALEIPKGKQDGLRAQAIQDKGLSHSPHQSRAAC